MSQSQSQQQPENLNQYQFTGLSKFLSNIQWVNKSTQPNKKKSPNYPCKRWGHSAVVDNKYMYIYGGFGGRGKSENVKQWDHIFRLDCTTFQWDKLPSNSDVHPQRRDSHTCAKLRNKLYMFGGSQDEIIFNDMWAFDLDTLEWNQVDKVPDNLSPRDGHTGIAINHRFMYILGGWNSHTLEIYDDQWIFDEDTRLFLKVDKIHGDQISKRESHSAVLLNEQVYIFGGQGKDNGKSTGAFQKDLYQVTFPPLSKLSNIFEKVFYGEPKEEISLSIEKIRSSSLLTPSARASHTATGYLDRFMFVIGGEGQKSDLPKDNDYEFKVEECQEDKPCYPKNDVWIFETGFRTWTKLQFKPKSTLFQSRCSHSLVSFKDSLIVFGGLKSTSDVLEDMMVLSLKDSENQLKAFTKEEIKNVCKYCQLIYGLHGGEEEKAYHQGSTCYQVQNRHHGKTEHRTTISFIDNIVSSSIFDWPLQCFGLLIDNSLHYAKSQSVEIKGKSKRRNPISWVGENKEDESESVYTFDEVKYLQIVENGSLRISYQDFLFMIHSFEFEALKEDDSDESVSIGKTGSCKRYNTYGAFMKLAGLRLGRTILYSRKIDDEFFVGLVSSNKQINPNVEDFIVFHYKLKQTENGFQSNDEWHRKMVVSSINHLFSEEEILPKLQNQSNILILDLKKYQFGPNTQYELQFSDENANILSFHNKIIKNKDQQNHIDFSLCSYLRVLYSDKKENTIFVQGQDIFRDQIQQEEEVEQISLKSDQHARFLISPKLIKQGILIYVRGRLISRFPKRLGEYTDKYKYSVGGSLHLDSFQTNQFTNDLIDKLHFEQIVQEIKELLAPYKIKFQNTNHPEEPAPRKQIKQNEEKQSAEVELEVQEEQKQQEIQEVVQETSI